MTAEENLQRAEVLLRDIISQDVLTDIMPDGNTYCTFCEAEQPDEVSSSRSKRKRVIEATHTGQCIITRIRQYFVDAAVPQ